MPVKLLSLFNFIVLVKVLDQRALKMSKLS